MDQAGKYEQLIGEKLEQIPLPDLVEAIWARIETELDTDLPGGDDNNSPDTGPLGGILGGRGLYLLIGALIMTFFFYPKNQNQNIESTIVLPSTETIAPENKPPDEVPPVSSRPNRTVQPKQQIIDSSASPAPILPQQANLSPVKLDDSAQANPPSLVITPPPVIKDTTGKKKSRGVKGLNDDDYRIVPKKDSSEMIMFLKSEVVTDPAIRNFYLNPKLVIPAA